LSDPGSTPNWQAFRRAGDVYLLMVNWVDGPAWLNGLPDCPFWIESHDVKYLKYAKRTGKTLNCAAVKRRLHAEAAVLAEAAGVVSISPVDQAILAGLSPHNLNLYVPSYDDVCHPIGAASPSASWQYDLLFVGSSNAFNADGLSQFMQSNRDWLARKKLAIAGDVSGHPRIQAALKQVPGARALGFVEDLAKIYASSKAVISPVDGTGLKIKVVEALRHGKPVFASDHSREGLPPGWGECVFDLDPAAMDAMLSADQLLGRAMHAAHAYCQNLGHIGDRASLLATLKAQI